MRDQPVNPNPQNMYDIESRRADPFNPDEIREDSELRIRKNFVKKVYGILTAQLALTTAIIVGLVATNATDAFKTHDGYFNTAGKIVFYGCLFIVVVISITLVCCLNVARKYPINYILLFVFTLAESLLLGVVCANIYAGYVITAALLTMTMTGILTLYAVTTKKEITFKGTLGWMFLWLILVIPTMCIMFIWALHLSALFTFLSIFFVFLYGFFIVWDTKLIVGQKRSGIQLSVDDYVLGALMLYTDIIGLFLNLLTLISRH
jgi:FtsH-binding integral membrane protein